MATALVTQIAYAVQTLFDPAGTAGRLVDLGKLANYGLLTSFTPAYLFTTGVNGTWYDPSDTTTLYRDAAGTQPVTAVEQPVGLMLDKSKGLVLGPDIKPVVGGWQAEGSTVAAGLNPTTIIFTSSPAGSAYQSSNTALVPVNSYVEISFTVSNYVSGSVIAQCGYLYYPPKVTANGVYTSRCLSGGNGALYVFCGTDTSATVTINSVRIIPGNHAFNSSGNSANFPVLSARYNLLTKTEDFSDAAWVKQSGTTVSSTKVAAPDGTLSAFSVTGNGTSGVYQIVPGAVSLGQTARSVYLRVPSGTTTVGIKDPVITQGTTTCNLTTDWQRFTLFETTASVGGNAAGIWIFNIPITGIEIAWPDLRVANDALNQPAYQRVNTATDYDTVGFKPYLRFNGTNQWLQTSSIDFTYTDKMFVCAGVRKLSDAGIGMVAELGSAYNTPGSFYFATPSSGSNFEFSSYGNAQIKRVVSTSAAPNTFIASASTDFSQSVPSNALTTRLNGASATGAFTGSATSGTYGNNVLNLGARAGSSLWFNGRLYGMVVAGKQASAAEITSTETYINQKTGAY